MTAVVTATDVVWALAVLLWTGGVLAGGWVLWSTRTPVHQQPAPRPLAPGWRVVPRRPYDYQLDGD